MQEMTDEGEATMRVTLGFKDGLRFGLGFAVSLLLLYVIIVVTLLYVIP